MGELVSWTQWRFTVIQAHMNPRERRSGTEIVEKIVIKWYGILNNFSISWDIEELNEEISRIIKTAPRTRGNFEVRSPRWGGCISHRVDRISTRESEIGNLHNVYPQSAIVCRIAVRTDGDNGERFGIWYYLKLSRYAGGNRTTTDTLWDDNRFWKERVVSRPKSRYM